MLLTIQILTLNLGNKGLHLNPTGKGKRITIKDNDIKPEHLSVFDSAMLTAINNSED